MFTILTNIKNTFVNAAYAAFDFIVDIFTSSLAHAVYVVFTATAGIFVSATLVTLIFPETIALLVFFTGYIILMIKMDDVLDFLAKLYSSIFAVIFVSRINRKYGQVFADKASEVFASGKCTFTISAVFEKMIADLEELEAEWNSYPRHNYNADENLLPA